jgi:rhomboid protease GluP
VLIDGEWWRLVTALFLHAGLAHLVFNVLALYSLAPFVERSLGSLRFLLVYFGSGVGGLAIVTWATYAFELNDRIVVGASGAIMGLVGATGAILAHAARAQGSLVARERLRAVGTIIGLQIVFDILVPQTSASAHLLGAGLGFLLARFARRS